MTSLKNQFAITYTIKNELRLLPAAINYHMAAGCRKIYVFIDGTNDGTDELVKSIDGVEIHKTCPPDDMLLTEKWILDISPMWKDNMDVRKRINTFRAAKMANEEGIEWLACIDPDELILPSVNDRIDLRMIPDFLGKIPAKFNQILLRNLELVPSSEEAENPFLAGKYFLNRFPVTEVIFRYSSALVRRAVNSPVMHAWYEHLFYKIRFFGLWPRLMQHPVTGEKIPTAFFLGYVNHKSIIRTNSFSKFNFDIHRWRKHERKPTSIYVGHVLHYDLFDYKYMAHKFRQRSENIVVKIFHCRHALTTIARDCSLEDVKKFFAGNIMLVNSKKINLLIKYRIVSEITCVRDFFLKSDERK